MTWLYLRIWKRGVRTVAWIQIVAVFVVTFVITARFGGMHTSGVFQVWSLIGPLAALLFLELSEVVVVVALFVTLFLVGGALPPSLCATFRHARTAAVAVSAAAPCGSAARRHSRPGGHWLRSGRVAQLTAAAWPDPDRR